MQQHTLAVLDWVSPPSRMVESGIALTVLLGALNNLRPLLRERRWVAAFVFGLIHGFGFAGALKSLQLPARELAISLFGFNVGVEIGQLAIVTAFVPLAFSLRYTNFYRQGVVRGGSILDPHRSDCRRMVHRACLGHKTVDPVISIHTGRSFNVWSLLGAHHLTHPFGCRSWEPFSKAIAICPQLTPSRMHVQQLECLNGTQSRRHDKRFNHIALRAADAKQPVTNVLAWNLYLPTDCVRTMVTMGRDYTA